MSASPRKSISFVVSFVFMTLIFSVAWYALTIIDKQNRDRTRDALQTVLITTQEALHLWISQRKFDVQDITQDIQIIQLTEELLSDTSNGLSQSLRNMRNMMIPRLSRYGDRDFFIISPQRINIASLRDENIGQPNLIHQQRKAYLDRAFAGNTVFVPTIRSTIQTGFENISDEKEEPAIFTVAPVKGLNGKIIAVLAIQINLKRHFTRITQLGRIGETGETYAFDEQGTLISESRFDAQLRRIGLVGTDSRGILSIRVADPGGNLLKGYTPAVAANKLPLTLMVSNATQGKSGYNTQGYRDYRGVAVFGA
ncbi:MAG: cache domain-containing protein, partial [Thioalkalispiraceae bacterium]